MDVFSMLGTNNKLSPLDGRGIGGSDADGISQMADDDDDEAEDDFFFRFNLSFWCRDFSATCEWSIECFWRPLSFRRLCFRFELASFELLEWEYLLLSTFLYDDDDDDEDEDKFMEDLRQWEESVVRVLSEDVAWFAVVADTPMQVDDDEDADNAL